MRVGWSPPKDRPSRQAGTDLEQLDFHKVVIVAGELAHRDEAIGLEVHALAPAATRPAGLFAAVRHRADRKRWVDQLHLTRRWSVLRCLWSALSRTEFAATWCSSRCNDKIDGRHERFFVLTPSPLRKVRAYSIFFLSDPKFPAISLLSCVAERRRNGETWILQNTYGRRQQACQSLFTTRVSNKHDDA